MNLLQLLGTLSTISLNFALLAFIVFKENNLLVLPNIQIKLVQQVVYFVQLVSSVLHQHYLTVVILITVLVAICFLLDVHLAIII